MRPIKFRAWHADNCQMVYDWAVYTDRWTFKANVAGMTIPMQYTGMLDRAGREIYEEDILEAKEYWGEKDYARVIWNTNQLQWYLARNGRLHEPLRSPFANKHMAFEIVGNTWETPELLENRT